MSNLAQVHLLFVDVASVSIPDNVPVDGCPTERQWELFSTRIPSGTSSGRTSRTIMLYLIVSQPHGLISFHPVDLVLYKG